MLFPPDAPSGAGPTTPAPSTAATGGTPSQSAPAAASPSGDAKPFTTPADDYQQRYTELEGKSKPWLSLADQIKAEYGVDANPAEVAQTIKLARQWNADMQAKKLRYIEENAAPTTPTNDGPPDNWDDMTSAQQRDWYRNENKQAIAAEREALKRELMEPIQQQMKIQGMQQQINMQAERLSREYNIPFEQAMAKTMEIASADSSKLLEMAFTTLAAPAKTEAEITRRVNEALAKAAQDRENAELAMVTGRGAPRWATETPQDPAERRQAASLKTLRAIREATRGKGAA